MTREWLNLGGAGLALLVGAALAGGVSAQPPAEGPSPNAFGIENPAVPWAQGHEGEAMNGACYGIAQLTVAYARMGLGATRALRAASSPRASAGATDAQKAADRLFLEQAAALAQNYAFRDPNWRARVYSQSSRPPDVETSLAASRPSPTNPQILWLNRPGGAHAVIVDGREELMGLDMVVYRVRDPNNPERAETLTYYKDRGQFGPFRGRSGTYETIRHDRSTLPVKNQRWIDAVANGLSQPAERRYAPVWRGDQDQPLTPEQYRRQLRPGTPGAAEPAPARPRGMHILEPPAPSSDLNGSIQGQTRVGGVRLHFDPAIVRESADPTLRWSLLPALTREITGEKAAFLVQQGGEEELAAIPASALLDSSDLPLTRLLGYVWEERSGELYLLGKREPGRRPIALDTLTVMLRSVWKEARVPAISLDPNPDDFFGPQQVRVLGVPAELRNTEPIRVMLDADYAMKRINLGDDALKLEGFQSHAELLTEGPTAPEAEYVRFWLYPRSNVGAEVLVTKTESGEVARYPSDVRLLTETMKRVREALVGTGEKDPISEETCAQFTANFHRIADERPVFRELLGVFDAAKLAFVLRMRGIRGPVLDRLAGRTPARVELRSTYPGIGPRMLGGPDHSGSVRFIGGGALSVHPAGRADVAAVRLVPAGWTGPPGRQVRLALPEAVAFTPAQAVQVDADLQAATALEEVMGAQFVAARARMDDVLARQPDHPLCRTIRGLCRSFMGDDRAALTDLNVAVKGLPPARLVRAIIRLRLGDGAGSLADVRGAAAAQPSEIGPLLQKARVELWNLNLPAAEADVARAQRLDPLEPDIQSLRSDLRVYRALGPEAARRYARAQYSVPLVDSLAFRKVTMLAQSPNPDAALQVLPELQRRYSNRRELPGEITHLGDRVDLLASELLLRRKDKSSVAEALAALERIRKRHPHWSSPLLLRADGDPGLTPRQRVALFRQAVALGVKDDVIQLELSARYGSDLRAFYGMKLFFKLMEERGTESRKQETAGGKALSPMGPETMEALRILMPLLPPGPMHAFLGFMRKYAPLAQRSTPPDKATQERAKADMRALIMTVRAPLKSAGDLNAVGLSVLAGLLGRELIRDPATSLAEADRLIEHLSRLAEADWVSETSLRAAAESQRRVLDALAERLRKEARGAPVKAGEPDDRTPDPAVLERLAAARRLSPFNTALLRRALLEDGDHRLRLDQMGRLAGLARTRLTAVVVMDLVTAEKQAIQQSRSTPQEAVERLVACERLLARSRLRLRAGS